MVIKTMARNEKIDTEEPKQENVSKEVLVIAQEIKIVKSLACNDLGKRNKQLKRLRRWLALRNRSSFPFTEEDFRRIWKGLYYTMWMSDKPLVQEDLSEQLGKLLLCFDGNLEASTNFFGAFLFTMYHQWFGIDQWRIDKFMMLVRRMLRYMFRVLKDVGWSSESIDLFNKHLTENVFADTVGATGLTMHILDIFCEELAKVANGDITADQVSRFIRPFVEFYCTQSDCKLTSHCRTRIFYHLLYQSTLGREYMEKYNAWKEMGFPTASINDLEKAEEPNEDDEMVNENEDTGSRENLLDPRAGNVDVFMPELPLDVECIIGELEGFLSKRESNTKRRKKFTKLLEICKTYQRGEFPLGIKRMPKVKLEPKEELIADKLEKLDEVEDELYGVGRKLKQLNKRKRRKILQSLNFDNIDEENFDKAIEEACPKNLTKKLKRKARNQLMNGWIEEDIDEDLAPKKKKAKKMKSLKSGEPNNKSAEPESIVIGTTHQHHKESTKTLNHKQASNQSLPTKKSLEVPKEKENSLENKVKKTKDIKNQNNAKNEQNVAEKVTDKKETSMPSNVEPTQKNNISKWDTPLEDGEVEYFIPSRKLKMKKANSELVLNPLAMKKKIAAMSMMSPQTPSTTPVATPKSTPKAPSVKRVKIALKHNTEQKPSEYIRQVKCSPNLPYDANKKPSKGLLKPHSVPSPINPFYKKKIGLRLLNDTM